MTSDNADQPIEAEEEHHHHHHHHDDHEHGHIHQHLDDVNAAHFDQHIASPESVTMSTWQRMYELFDTELVEQRSWYGLPPALKNTQPSNDTTTTTTTSSPRLIRMFDYACGGGHASRTLLPYVDEIRGVDVSAKSIEAYNAWATTNSIPSSAMHAVQGNVMTPSGLAALDSAGPDSDLHDFDLVVCIMALHHISDQQLAIQRLADRLRPGGSLLVVDWNQDGCLRFKDKEHKAKHTTSAHGFGEEVMKGFMEAAGLTEFGYKELLGFTEDGITAMSRAKKPVVEA